MTILDQSIAVLRKAEELVIGRSFEVPPGFWRDALDTLLHGPWFVISGFEAIGLVAIRCAAAVAGMAALLSVVSLFVDGKMGSAQGLLWAALVMGVGAVLLGLPSSIDTRLIRRTDVTKLADLIASHARDEVTGKVLREGVEAIQVATVRRMLTVRWALGALWALLIWTASSWVLNTEVPQEIRNSAFSYSLIGAILVLIAGAVLAAYQMSHNRVSQTILFAFLEFEALKARRLVQSVPP